MKRASVLAPTLIAIFFLAGAAYAATPLAPSHAAKTEAESGPSSPVEELLNSRFLAIPWPNASLKREFLLPDLGAFTVAGITFHMAITKHLVFLWVAAVVVLLVMLTAARKARNNEGAPKGVRNLVESIVVFIRDEIAMPTLGPRYGRTLLPWLLSVFFFILACNLMGLIPFGATPTLNISVTAGLAILSFFVIQGVAIREAGFGGWLAHLTGGVHWVLWPIMIPVEIMGLLTKPFALCIRLFANMTADDMMIVAVIWLIFIFRSTLISGIVVPFDLVMYGLAILVAFIQAYIFTMLTAVFAGLGVHKEHEAAEEQEAAS